ncbi:tyrosine-type recombinase/integrase [Clostridium sp. Marseille-P2415]|uniref:tyrosine-type recombinase/integrase n=1 Tax=Clostridium sp. Marseille-P2415 TaxID=1805471 RepID=UPI00098869C2|nr:tyrosine-type recombinase/integrase [Clostridium sp. Marseille-P2415]
MGKVLTIDLINQYENHLYEEEKAKLTIEKYIRDIKKFYIFLPAEKAVDKKKVIEYKEYLKNHYQVSSVNSMLVALNRFLEYAGWLECKVHQFKIQRALFCKKETCLSKIEYETLIKTAKREGDIQLNLLMQTICSTGIRVSELQYITVQALESEYAQINNKGKNRVIFLPKPLIKVLRSYCVSNGITSGPIFITKSNSPINRTTIWKKMKGLCKKAKVDERKVFPHNLRHLFAFTFYRAEKNLLRLAEVLGHSSIETTRIYTATTGEEHQKLISRLGLVFDSRYKNCII